MTQKLYKNIGSGIFAQLFVVLANFISVPLLLNFFSKEVYGLVAFYFMIQLVFSFLDSGLSPLIIRQTAAVRANIDLSRRDYSALIHLCLMLFIFLGFVGFSIIFLLSEFISYSWLTFQELESNKVVEVIQLMAFIVGLRLISGFFRALFIGHQNIVILNYLNISVSFLRFILVIFYLISIEGDIVDYFLYQLACGLLELIALVLLNKRHNKFTYTKTSFIEKVKSIKFHYKFALYSAFGVISWIAVTSVDKLLISRFFSLENFSAFSIGVMGASVFLYLSGPLSNSLIPRFTEVFEKEGLNALKSILENLLNLSLVLLLPLSIYASFFSEEVLLLWTGNEEIAAEAKIILSFYSMGNVIALLSSFVYFLQAAKGELKLHFIGSTLFMVIYLPTLLFFIDAFGLVGSGYAWFIVNLILFLTWSGYVFKTHMSGFYFQWLYKVFLPSILISYILVYFEYCIYLLFPEKIFLLSLTPVFFCFNSVVLYLFLYGPTKEPFSYLTN